MTPRLTPNAVLDFSKEAARIGANDRPALLFKWWLAGRLTHRDLWAVITNVWMLAETPQQALGVATWVDLFRKVGFVADDPEIDQPLQPLTIFRGASWGHRRNMAWTSDFDQALWFAQRILDDDRPRYVFRATVDPGAVLALIGMEGGRNEREVVVEPSQLPRLGRDTIIWPS